MRPDTRFGARAVLAGLALAIVTVPFALLLFLVEDKWRPLLRVDDGARDELHALAGEHDGVVTALRVLSFIGSMPTGIVVFGGLALWLLWKRLPRLAAFVVVTMIGSSLINALVKLLVHRARPVLDDPVAHAAGQSFPSGHAQGAVVAAAVVLLVFLPTLRGRWRAAAIAAAVLYPLAMGFARVGLGVHYVSDVLAGYALGAAWVAATAAAFVAWRRERGRPEVTPTRGLEPEALSRGRRSSTSARS